MGLFRKTEMHPVPATPEAAASGSVTQRATDIANAGIDKAAAIYNRNPKLIGGLAAVAGAILLARMKRSRG
jgi:hypothetical protein